MKVRKTLQSHILFIALFAALLGFCQAVQAQQEWHATIGGQSADMSKQRRQVLSFQEVKISERWLPSGPGSRGQE